MMTSVLMAPTIGVLFKGPLYHFSRESSSLGAKSPIQFPLSPLPASETGRGEFGLLQRADSKGSSWAAFPSFCQREYYSLFLNILHTQ